MQSVGDRIQLGWIDIEKAVNNLALNLAHYGESPKRILAIGRGGLIPATMLSHQIGINDVQCLRFSSYKGEDPEKVKIHLPFQPTNLGKNMFQVMGVYGVTYGNPETLIIDDLWDTGNTQEYLRRMFPEAINCTLFHKLGVAHEGKVRYPGMELPEGKWVVFPWEV